jgi:transposase-like protein
MKNKNNEIRRRQRLTVEQRFEIVQELKARKCSIKEIAAVYNTTPRNVWRWKVIYGPYDNIADAVLKPREIKFALINDNSVSGLFKPDYISQTAF